MFILSATYLSCDHFADKAIIIKVTNKSNKIIYFNTQCNNVDTAIIFSPESKKIANPFDTGTEVLPNSQLSNKNENNIQVFVYSKDTFDKYGWEKIKSDYLFLKVYHLKYYKKRKDRNKSSTFNLTYE